MRPEESFLSQPIRSLQTMLRVIAKYDDTYESIIPDGIYGAETVKAVAKLQENIGLPTTGIVDQTTWDHIVNEYEEADIEIRKAEVIEIIFEPGKVFDFNEYSPYIYLLQGILSYLSELHPVIGKPGNNGVLDEDTAKSLKDFQMLCDLPISGQLDRNTWRHLVKQFTLNANHFHSEDL